MSIADANTAYAELEDHFQRFWTLHSLEALLTWDMATMLPSNSGSLRGQQFAMLTELKQTIMLEPQISDLLDAASAADLDDMQQANLREMRHQWIAYNSVAPAIKQQITKMTAECQMQWEAARKANDFNVVQDSLTELVELTREAMHQKGDQLDLSPYDAALDEYCSGFSGEQIDTIFDDLAQSLPPMIDQVCARQAPKQQLPVVAVELQQATVEQLAATFGFDLDSGRVDKSTHPMTCGVADDCRLTTRYEQTDFTFALVAAVHELGHALFEQGLPQAWRRQPLCIIHDMALHESQSIILERQLAHTREFWDYWMPALRQDWKQPGLTTDVILSNLHHVKPDFIRVSADELTYPLHIILRYRLEKAMLEGELAVADLPDAWVAQSEALLGLTPNNDVDGCLQDVHWYSGAFGYFPAYTLGAMTAAQLYATLQKVVPDLNAQLAQGQFAVVVDWLREHVHQHAARFTVTQLLDKVTGQPLNVDYFKQHLMDRYC